MSFLGSTDTQTPTYTVNFESSSGNVTRLLLITVYLELETRKTFVSTEIYSCTVDNVFIKNPDFNNLQILDVPEFW